MRWRRKPTSWKQFFFCSISLHKFKVARDLNHIYRECSECGFRVYIPRCYKTSPIDIGWVYSGKDFCQDITRRLQKNLAKRKKLISKEVENDKSV